MPIHFQRKLSALLLAPMLAMFVWPAHSDGVTAFSSLARELTISRHEVTPISPVLLAQKSRTRRIQFAPGKDYAIVRDAVVRGTRDTYLLGAQKGQVMKVQIESVEDNAVFDVVTPSTSTGQRRILKQEAVFWSGKLPQTGDYQIVVGSIRGNATYKLTVTIR
jgi:hypothetical protein